MPLAILIKSTMLLITMQHSMQYWVITMVFSMQSGALTLAEDNLMPTPQNYVSGRKQPNWLLPFSSVKQPPYIVLPRVACMQLVAETLQDVGAANHTIPS